MRQEAQMEEMPLPYQNQLNEIAALTQAKLEKYESLVAALMKKLKGQKKVISKLKDDNSVMTQMIQSMNQQTHDMFRNLKYKPVKKETISQRKQEEEFKENLFQAFENIETSQELKKTEIQKPTQLNLVFKERRKPLVPLNPQSFSNIVNNQQLNNDDQSDQIPQQDITDIIRDTRISLRVSKANNLTRKSYLNPSN